MKIHRILSISCGLVPAACALGWWFHLPFPQNHLSNAPPAARLKPGFDLETQPQSFAPQEQSCPDDSASMPVEESPDPDISPERRCLDLAGSDPRAALTLALDTRLDEAIPALLENLASQWASRDFHAAHEWVTMQEPGDFRDGLIARIVHAGSKSDPATAGRIVAEEMPPGASQDEAAICVLHQWALHDLESAAAWAAAFPPSDLRARAITEIENLREKHRGFSD